MSRLDRIGDWVERGKLARYHAEKLAMSCEISGSQLRRYFADAIGQPPQSWLNELRLWQAARLLCCTSLAVKCIASDLGYADESHFCRRFKAYFACTPTEFPRRYRIQLGLDAPLDEFAQSAKKHGVKVVPPLGVSIASEMEGHEAESARLDAARLKRVRRIPQR